MSASVPLFLEATQASDRPHNRAIVGEARISRSVGDPQWLAGGDDQFRGRVAARQGVAVAASPYAIRADQNDAGIEGVEQCLGQARGARERRLSGAHAKRRLDPGCKHKLRQFRSHRLAFGSETTG